METSFNCSFTSSRNIRLTSSLEVSNTIRDNHFTIIFNETCLNNDLLPTYTNMYIYIWARKAANRPADYKLIKTGKVCWSTQPINEIHSLPKTCRKHSPYGKSMPKIWYRGVEGSLNWVPTMPRCMTQLHGWCKKHANAEKRWKIDV